MKFEIIEQLSVPETIAVDKSIHELQRLKKVYGDGRWRKIRASISFGFSQEMYAERKFTGMRLAGKGKKNRK